MKKTGYDKKIKIAFDERNLRGWHHPDQGNRIKGQDIKARDKVKEWIDKGAALPDK